MSSHVFLRRVNWRGPHTQKEIALSTYIARHQKLGSSQCRSSCPAISEKKEGLCQSPRELWVQWGIQHQASIDAWVPSVTGDKIKYLEKDVTGEKKNILLPSLLHWAPSPRADASEKFPSRKDCWEEEVRVAVRFQTYLNFGFKISKILPICKKLSLFQEDQPNRQFIYAKASYEMKVVTRPWL